MFKNYLQTIRDNYVASHVQYVNVFGYVCVGTFGCVFQYHIVGKYCEHVVKTGSFWTFLFVGCLQFHYLSHCLLVCLSLSLGEQECAAGFYRLRAGSLASAPASKVPTAAGMGSCVQCQCSGHSSTCDPETAICQVL